MSVATADSTHLSSPGQSLQAEELHKMNAYWRAANYLSVGQIYVYENPLLREPLKVENTKPRLLGQFGTTPGHNFIYVLVIRAQEDWAIARECWKMAKGAAAIGRVSNIS